MKPKLSFHSVAFFRYSIDEAARTLARVGYDAIELGAEKLSWADPLITPDIDVWSRKKLVETIRGECGLDISSIAAHRTFIEADNAARQRSLDYMKGCIDLAVDLGVNIVHVISGHVPSGLSELKAWEWLVDGTAECIEYAKARSLRLAFEAVVGMLVARVSDLFRLINDIEGLGLSLYVNYDPSHFQLYNDNLPRTVEDFGDRIIHVHVKDAKGTPLRFEFPPLGLGEVNFEDVLRALRQVGYGGFLSVEYEGSVFGYYADPERACRESKRFLSELVDKIW